MFKTTLRRVLVTAAAALVAVSGQAAGAATLTGAGSTFVYPIFSKWFDAYGRATGVRVNYQSIGSGGGIQQLKAHTVDFGASDAPLSDKELREMPAPVIQFPDVAGAIVMSYNVPGVRTGLKLTPEAIAGIYLGKIRRWNDPAIARYNPGIRLPARPIIVAHRSDGSGTTYIFTHYLAAISPEWARRVGTGKSVSWPVGLGGKGNEGVTGLIKQAPGGFGYIELAYAITNHLPMAVVRNKAGHFMKPTIAATSIAVAAAVGRMKKDVRVSIVNSPNPKAYPICGFSYILVYKNIPNRAKAREVVNLLNWAFRSGQKMVKSLDYVPLPPPVVALNLAHLKMVK